MENVGGLVRWQTALIKSVDPESKVAISFGSWSDYHEQMPSNAIHNVDGVLELISRDVDFDVVAIEYHYGTLQDGNLADLRQALAELKISGKQIFLWEVFYPGGTDPEYQDNWSWAYIPEGGYTEAWQAKQLAETLSLAYEDTQIIGIIILHFQDLTYHPIDPRDWEAGWRCHAGLIRTDGTPKEAYFKVKEMWKTLSSQP